MKDEISITGFPIVSTDKLRYCDTDRQGHINNAVFCTALETGRTEILFNPAASLASEGTAFVIVKLDENGGAIFDHGSGGIVLLRAA